MIDPLFRRRCTQYAIPELQRREIIPAIVPSRARPAATPFLLLVVGCLVVGDVEAQTPWPAQYKISPWDVASLTPADVVGPDGIVYPDVTKAGVEGGIPDTSGWPVFNVANYSGTAMEKIAAALATAQAAPSGGVVYLPNGTYDVDDEILIEKSRIVFKGESKEGVILRIVENPSATATALFNFVGGNTWSAPYRRLTQDFKRGSSSFTLDSAGGYSVGDWIQIQTTLPNMTDPGNSTMSQRYNRPETGLIQNDPNRFGRKFGAKIIAINPTTNVVTLDRPVTHDIYTDEEADMRKLQSITFCGVENLTIRTVSGAVKIEPIRFKAALNCWLRDVVIDKTRDWPYRFSGHHFEIRNCDFLGTWADINNGSTSYQSLASYTLIDNCRARDLRHMAMHQGLHSSVIRNCTFTGATVQSPQLHGAHPHDFVIENNEFLSSGGDAYSVDDNASLVHGSEGPRGVFYNNRHTGGSGKSALSFVEGHIIAYNTFLNASGKINAGIEASNKCFDTIIRGNSFHVSPNLPLILLNDPTSTGWEVRENKIFGSNGILWEGDGEVLRSDYNRLYRGTPTAAAAPETPSIYSWQLANAGTDRLVVTFDKSMIPENGGSLIGRVTRVHPMGGSFAPSLEVTLTGTAFGGRVNVPSVVTIPANASFATFSVTAVNNTAIDGLNRVVVNASASGYLRDAGDFRVTDDESPAIALARSKPDRFATGPTSGWANGDFGLTGLQGNSSFNASTGTFTVTGSGANLDFSNPTTYWGRQLCYVSLTGNGEIIARVKSAPTGCRAGIMFTDDESALSEAYVLSADQGVFEFSRYDQYRPGTLRASGTDSSPVWLRIRREGAVLTAYSSTQTIKPTATQWTHLNTFDFYKNSANGYKSRAEIDSKVYLGLWVTSGSLTQSASATFEQVSFVGNVSAAGSPPPPASPVGPAG